MDSIIDISQYRPVTAFNVEGIIQVHLTISFLNNDLIKAQNVNTGITEMIYALLDTSHSPKKE